LNGVDDSKQHSYNIKRRTKGATVIHSLI